MPSRPAVAILAGLLAAVVHAATAVMLSQYIHMPAFFAARDLGWNVAWIPVALTIVDLVVLALIGAFVVRATTSLTWMRGFALFAAGYCAGYLTYDLVALGPNPGATFERLWSVLPPMLIALTVSALAFRAVVGTRVQHAA
jgi:hypothetical protein